MHATLSYCAIEARRYDRDRFLCALYAPGERREAVFTLLAFNAEIARIRETVREPMVGEIRLQWWREAVAGLFHGGGTNPISGHPVLDALRDTVAGCGLTHAPFEAIFDGRRADFQETGPADMAELVRYADDTSAALTRLILEALAFGEDVKSAVPTEAGRHVGIAWAITGLLRAAGHHAAQGRVHLPAAELETAGVSRDDLIPRRFSPALAGVVEAVAATARSHLDQARAQPHAERRYFPALLPAVFAEDYLKRLERAGFNPFSPALERGRLVRQMRLALNARRGAY